MYITEMDRVNFILEQARKSTLSQEDILKIYLDEWLQSRQRGMMLKGQAYYSNDNDINSRKRMAIGSDGQLVEDKKLTNSRLAHAFTKKLVDQKTQYLFGLPMSLQCKNEQYAVILNDYFGKPMLKKLKNIGKEAINKGIAWMQAYISAEGDLCFKKIPAEQVIPIWVDDDHEELSAVIRVYNVEEYEGRTKKEVTKAEYWSREGVTYYTLYSGRLLPDVERESGAHFRMQQGEKVQGMNFTQVPFIYFRYNEEEQPLLKFIKPLIDDYDLLSSDDSNNILDSPNATLILKGYGGENLGEFRQNLAVFKAIKIDGDKETQGGVEPLNVPINTAEVQIHLQQTRKDLYETGRGVDTQSEKLGTASGVALKFVYADLDLDCNGLETECQSSFKRMRFFIDTYLQITGQGDYTGEDVTFIMNRDGIINETDAITNCKNSMGIISEQTIVANHPFVTDVDQELAQLKAERAEEKPADDYGEPPEQGAANQTVDDHEQ